jgi:hypothetical protein
MFFLATNYQNGVNVPNYLKICQKAVKYDRWPLNRPNGHKIYQHVPSQDRPKFTQIVIFGLKTNHLATQSTILSSEKYFF